MITGWKTALVVLLGFVVVEPLCGQQWKDQQAAESLNNNSVPVTGGAIVEQPRQPFELTPQEAEYMDKLLDHWQTSSEKVKLFTCRFQRFSYDSENVNYRDPKDNRLAAAGVTVGHIRHAAPDRGLYETTQTWVFASPPAESGGDAVYKEVTGDELKEKWICDGNYIYEYDFNNKVLYDEEVPVEMRGNGMANSPIPFLFGAKKADILDRYWARPIAQPNQNEFWLEVYPKRIEDARMYLKVELILAREDFLPKAVHVYSPQYDPKKGNFHSQYFLLEDRQVNSGMAKLQDFLRDFVRPQTPAFGGWRRMDRSPVYRERQAGANPERK
jgi:TIGR03009 family protein